MAIKIETNPSGDAIDVLLDDLNDWDEWAADNHEALIEDYGTIDNALKHACDGGLRMGGGAAPIIDVFFVDSID